MINAFVLIVQVKILKILITLYFDKAYNVCIKTNNQTRQKKLTVCKKNSRS